jgi:hypothetical protein
MRWIHIEIESISRIFRNVLSISTNTASRPTYYNFHFTLPRQAYFLCWWFFWKAYCWWRAVADLKCLQFWLNSNKRRTFFCLVLLRSLFVVISSHSTLLRFYHWYSVVNYFENQHRNFGFNNCIQSFIRIVMKHGSVLNAQNGIISRSGDNWLKLL